ncbi:hypothetical protein [Alkalicoccobacillus plakortidis]|uniref:GH10 domain-containing protein n=1 Tax=Alkalicoccobacillus plakortidis TaxID=444060 RepID=A0ABT0XIX9_9BACI|nr:hypothetical protein [Alkalicoccobacillus plakortidis]MCM2675834.1 hypothetical protein [Alkalicoccobacillus plakortidis]
MNEWNNIPISIWYGLRDNGTDWSNELHHFGLMDAQEQHKPSYEALMTITSLFADYQFTKRVETEEQIYALQFTHRSKSIYALWTTADDVQSYNLPLAAGNGRLISLYGEEKSVEWEDDGFEVELSGSPVYLEVE